jgi:hypothetical protein
MDEESGSDDETYMVRTAEVGVQSENEVVEPVPDMNLSDSIFVRWVEVEGQKEVVPVMKVRWKDAETQTEPQKVEVKVAVHVDLVSEDPGDGEKDRNLLVEACKSYSDSPTTSDNESSGSDNDEPEGGSSSEDSSDEETQPELVRTGVSEREAEDNPWLEMSLGDVRRSQDEDNNIFFLKSLLRSHPSRPKWMDVATQNAEIKALWVQWDRLMEKEGVLYRRVKDPDVEAPWRYVTPPSLRAKFFQALHHGGLAGHQGVGRTLSMLRQRFYWPRMKDDVTAWCRRCHVCGESKPLPGRGRAALKQTVVGMIGMNISLR